MNVYESLHDLYDIETVENEVNLTKDTQTINSTSYNGYLVTVKDEKYFIHHLLDVNGKKRTMGNKWAVYNLTKSKYVLSGVKTNKDAIKFLKNI